MLWNMRAGWRVIYVQMEIGDKRGVFLSYYIYLTLIIEEWAGGIGFSLVDVL